MIAALIVAAATVAIVAMLCVTALRAWRGWLDLRRLELAQPAAAANEENVGLRIELAAVRERLRKLEAIASGVDP